MSSLSTHVLDAVAGNPASGIAVTVFVRTDGGDWDDIAWNTTDSDGRVSRLVENLRPGTYRIVFDTQSYFESTGTRAFYPEVVITFLVDEERHYHVPALLSPYAYSTYRGS